MTFLKKTSTKKLVTLTILVLLATVFLSAGYSYAQTDTSILTMQGTNWNLKIDATLQTALESKNQPYVSVTKAGTEKELFLTLNSLADCKTGQVEFKVQTNGLTIYKQLPLDKELNVTEYDFVNATIAMKKDQVAVSRPENVVNSFACFDSQSKKVLHIYASKLIDAKGNSVWVDSDLKYGLLIVYLDQKFLDSAVFPVLVDPTFGYNTVGGTSSNFFNGLIVGSQIYCPTSTTINNIYVYLGTYAGNARVAIYGDSGASPNNLLAQSDSIVLTANGWMDFSGFNQLIQQNNFYWLLFEVSSSATTVYWDNFGTYTEYTYTVAYGAFPSSLSGLGALDSKHYSIYAMGDSFPSPSPAPASTVTNDIFAGIAILMFMIIIGFILSLKPYSIINIVYGILVLSVTAGLLLGGYLAGLWFFAFAGVAVGLICLLRGTDLL